MLKKYLMRGILIAHSHSQPFLQKRWDRKCYNALLPDPTPYWQMSNRLQPQMQRLSLRHHGVYFFHTRDLEIQSGPYNLDTSFLKYQERSLFPYRKDHRGIT